MKTELEKAAEKYSSIAFSGRQDLYDGFIAGAKWQQEQNDWKNVFDETPPNNIQLLVQNPQGVVYLANWRESYQIFDCQAKSESSLDWKWKTI